MSAPVNDASGVSAVAVVRVLGEVHWTLTVATEHRSPDVVGAEVPSSLLVVEQPSAVSARSEASSEPVFVSVTVTVRLPPGLNGAASGVLVVAGPPYLLIDVQSASFVVVDAVCSGGEPGGLVVIETGADAEPLADLAWARTGRGGTHAFGLAAAVVITHDLNLASEFADEMILMKNGAIQSKGAPEKVLTENNLAEVFGVKVLLDKNPVSGRRRVTTLFS